MLGLLLPGLVVVGAAASPIVAAAMASVFPNRLGDWVEDNVIPNATYPSLDTVEEDQVYDKGGMQVEQQQAGRGWVERDEDASISRKRYVVPPFEGWPRCTPL